MRFCCRHISTLFIILFTVVITGCEKRNEDMYYGIDEIDNTLYGTQVYYAIGFSFDEGKKVSTMDTPFPDITIHLNTDISGNITGKYINSPNLTESFSLVGTLDTAKEAEESFNNLLDVGSPQWSLSATGLEENQVWLYLSTQGNFVKLRVIDINTDNSVYPPYVEIKFEWRLQPDGTSVFSS